MKTMSKGKKNFDRLKIIFNFDLQEATRGNLQDSCTWTVPINAIGFAGSYRKTQLYMIPECAITGRCRAFKGGVVKSICYLARQGLSKNWKTRTSRPGSDYWFDMKEFWPEKTSHLISRCTNSNIHFSVMKFTKVSIFFQ